jgi:hypothetical protein
MENKSKSCKYIHKKHVEECSENMYVIILHHFNIIQDEKIISCYENLDEVKAKIFCI